jgi:hypothetical protein
MHTDGKNRRSSVALLFTAGDLQRSAVYGHHKNESK